MAQIPGKKTSQYVDKDEFNKAMCEYAEACDKAAAEGLPRPRASNYIGECLIKIADGVGQLNNFRGYPYLDEMKLDAIENAVRYLHNYKIDKGSAFNWITNGMEKIFGMRISKEHRQVYYRCKSFDNAGGFDMFGGELDPIVKTNLEAVGISDDYQTWAANYERKQETKRERNRERSREREASKRSSSSVVNVLKREE